MLVFDILYDSFILLSPLQVNYVIDSGVKNLSQNRNKIKKHNSANQLLSIPITENHPHTARKAASKMNIQTFSWTDIEQKIKAMLRTLCSDSPTAMDVASTIESHHCIRGQGADLQVLKFNRQKFTLFGPFQINENFGIQILLSDTAIAGHENVNFEDQGALLTFELLYRKRNDSAAHGVSRVCYSCFYEPSANGSPQGQHPSIGCSTLREVFALLEEGYLLFDTLDEVQIFFGQITGFIAAIESMFQE